MKDTMKLCDNKRNVPIIKTMLCVNTLRPLPPPHHKALRLFI